MAPTCAIGIQVDSLTVSSRVHNKGEAKVEKGPSKPTRKKERATEREIHHQFPSQESWSEFRNREISILALSLPCGLLCKYGTYLPPSHSTNHHQRKEKSESEFALAR
jgi:hypothetical protein